MPEPALELMTLPSVPQSVSAVRRFAVDACERAGHRMLCDTVALLVSEVATNALVHGSGEVRVSVLAGDGRIRVEVADDGEGQPQPRPANPDAEGGRGLALVDALATDWGTRPTDPGKVVWFELRS